MVSWESNGFTIEEGPRPGTGGEERYEYYFLVLKDDRKVFHYCLWASRSTLSKRASAERTTENVVIDTLQKKARRQLEQKIEHKNFTNVVFMVDEAGEREIPLDELDTKLG